MNIRQIAKNADREAAEHLAAIERDLAYITALALINQLDPNPCHNSYWFIDGRRCDTLDEALAALLECEAELRKTA